MHISPMCGCKDKARSSNDLMIYECVGTHLESFLILFLDCVSFRCASDYFLVSRLWFHAVQPLMNSFMSYANYFGIGKRLNT